MALLCIAWASGLGLAALQPTETTERRGEADIVVTGERVERRLLDSPSSVSVFQADDIDALAGVDRVEDLLARIPGIQIGSGGEGPTIRGQDSTGVLRDLPAFLGGTRPRTTLQVDGRAVGFNEFVFGAAPLWDVARVEVFRSPQTTTQGRNSIAGAIFVETNDPTYDWQARARLIAGNEELVQGSAMLSGPIVADQIAFRIAADLRDGRTSSRIGDFIPDADPNRDHYALLRARLLAEPAGLPGARLELTYSHVESAAPQVEGVSLPFEARRDALAAYGVSRQVVDSLSGMLAWRLTDRLNVTTTLSVGDSLIRRLARPGVGRTRIDASDASGEIVLRWQPSTGAQLVGGVHLLGNRMRQDLDLSASIGAGTFTDDQSSLGLFGELLLRPVDGIDVIAGLRYQRDRQARLGSLGDAVATYGIDYDGRFEAWLPKLSVSYAPGEDVRVGVLVQRAYNPGGATIRLDTGETDRFGAESLWAYELFARAALMGGRLTARANLFYNQIEDAQRPQARIFLLPDGTGVLVTDIDNAPAAETYGLELDVTWRATRRLDMRFGLGLLGSRTIATVDPADPIQGKQFQRAPSLTATAAIDWRPADPLRVSVQARHNDGYFSDDRNSLNRRIDGATVLDARASWRAGPLTLFGYVRNILDDFHMTYLFSPIQGTAGDPRQVGIGIEAAF